MGETEAISDVLPEVQIGNEVGPGPAPCEIVHLKTRAGEHIGSLVVRRKLEFNSHGFSAYGRQVEADEYGQIRGFPTEGDETWNLSVVTE